LIMKLFIKNMMLVFQDLLMLALQIIQTVLLLVGA